VRSTPAAQAPNNARLWQAGSPAEVADRLGAGGRLHRPDPGPPRCLQIHGGRVRPARGGCSVVGSRASPAAACVLTTRKHVGGRSAARPARPTVVGIIRTRSSGGGRPARTPVRGEARRSSPQGCRASGG
ncbi:unnamed protein product, partial [Ixodes hexagonus]